MQYTLRYEYNTYFVVSGNICNAPYKGSNLLCSDSITASVSVARWNGYGSRAARKSVSALGPRLRGGKGSSRLARWEGGGYSWLLSSSFPFKFYWARWLARFRFSKLQAVWFDFILFAPCSSFHLSFWYHMKISFFKSPKCFWLSTIMVQSIHFSKISRIIRIMMFVFLIVYLLFGRMFVSFRIFVYIHNFWRRVFQHDVDKSQIFT